MPRFVTAPRPALTLLLFALPALFATACGSGSSADAPASTATHAASVAGAVGETSGSSQLQAIVTASPVATETPAATATAEPAPISTPEAEEAAELATETPEAIIEASADAAALVATSSPEPAPTELATQVPTATSTLALPTATAVAPTPTATPAVLAVARTASAPANVLAAEEISLINQYRAANGQGPLRSDAALNAEAYQYATVLGDTNTFGHTGADGSTPFTRFAAAGFGGAMCGEALAAGQETSGEALQTWTTSPAHNAILLGANADSVGVGYYYAPDSTYKHYWVLVTGRAGAANC